MLAPPDSLRELILRPCEDADWGDVALLLSDPRVARWHRPGVGAWTRAEVRSRWGAPQRPAVAVAARAGDDGALIAVARVEDGALEYAVRPASWRQGHGCTVAAAALQAARAQLGTEVFTARVAGANLASRRLLERMRFVPTGPIGRRYPSQPQWLLYRRVGTPFFSDAPSPD
jgi:RimJ/RimL family protein N-acetyltransferase